MRTLRRRPSLFSTFNRSGLAKADLRGSIEPLEGRVLLSSVVVNTALDQTDAPGSTTVSLRDAVAVANAATSATTITFDPTAFATAKTITLTGSTLVLNNANQPVTITGPAAGVTILSNGAVKRGVEIATGATVAISRLTISKFTYLEGAGLFNSGTLTLSNSTLTGNFATSADDGGGFENGGTATLINVTVANNSGIGIYNFGTLTIKNTTVSGNKAVAGYEGGGVYNSGTASLGNSIVAGNGTNASNSNPDLHGDFISQGYNLIGVTDNTTGWNAHDLTGSLAHPLSASLGSLASNGGPTQTMLPLTGSSAVNHGSNALMPSGITTDQRGFVRIVNTTVDIGAVEVQLPAIASLTGTPNPVNKGSTLTLTANSVTGNDRAVTAVNFYRETNGKTGLQTGTGGDTLVGTDTSATGGWTAAIATTALAVGTYTYYAQATDAASSLSNIVSTTNTVQAAVATSITVTAPAAQTASAGQSKSFLLGSFAQSNATGPFTVTVNWGDGSANSSFAMTAAGTITAQSHTFATSGSKTVTVTVKDSASHTSNSPTFVVTVSPATTLGSLAGTVYTDTNANGIFDTGEKGMAGVKVYLDANKNGAYDTGEATLTTDANGIYKFTNLAAGTFRVREVLPINYVLTNPTSGFIDVPMTAGQIVTGKLFFNALSTGSIAGRVFNDANSNGLRDTGEAGLGLFKVFIDTNNDGNLQTTEKSIITDIFGNFSFTGLTAGSYTVRVVAVTGLVATKPTGGVLTIKLTTGQVSTGTLFGEKSIA